MYLGTTRTWWIITGLLILLGAVLLIVGHNAPLKILGGLALVAGVGVFAAAPTGAESRRRRVQREQDRAAAATAPPPPRPTPPPAAPYRPARKIEGGDPSEV